MKTLPSLLAGTLALGALLSGCVGRGPSPQTTATGGPLGNATSHPRGALYQSESEATTSVVLFQPPLPPPPRVEVVTVRPAPRMVWIDGYWVYSAGERYAWMPGRWTTPPPRHRAFVTPHWASRGPSYVYVEGYWH